MTDRVLAVDPGREKCGVGVVDGAGAILFRGVVPTAACEERLAEIIADLEPGRVVVGDGTWSKQVQPRVDAALARARARNPGLPQGSNLVNERHTTERARALYFQVNPPRGLWRLVPLGLQVPREPYDDFAAIVIARDFLNNRGDGRGAGGALK